LDAIVNDRRNAEVGEENVEMKSREEEEQGLRNKCLAKKASLSFS
jgi:hypothetical protein